MTRVETKDVDCKVVVHMTMPSSTLKSQQSEIFQSSATDVQFGNRHVRLYSIARSASPTPYRMQGVLVKVGVVVEAGA